MLGFIILLGNIPNFAWEGWQYVIVKKQQG